VKGERGQATIEWTAAVLVVALTLGAAIAVVPAVDDRSFGGLIAHRIVCAVRGGCDDGDRELVAAYGDRDAELVRRYAPGLVYEPGTYTLPVDFRECRSHQCSDAPDERGLDVHRSARGGVRASVFTHVVHRDGETFIQYWLYYPDSPSTFLGSHAVLKHLPGGDPADHRDDWESFQVRVDTAGAALVRASSHHGYQGCKQRRCKNTWTAWTGWSRVSKGSHAGHIPLRREPVGPLRMAPRRRLRAGQRYREVPLLPGRDLDERTSTAAGLRLVPLESVDTGAYVPLSEHITPPWRKEVYREPLSDATS
jgi:hypothetical protein